MFMDFVILLKNEKSKDAKQACTENGNSMRIQIPYLTWRYQYKNFLLMNL